MNANTAARKITAYINRRTGTGSPEAAAQALVNRAVRAVWEVRDNPTNPFTGEPNVKAEVRADVLLESVELVTCGELTADDFIAAYVTPAVTLGEYRGGYPGDYRAEIHRAGCSDLGKTARKTGFGWVEKNFASVAEAMDDYLDDPDGLANEDEVRVFPCADGL